jgi:hypothetical protein
MNSIISNLHIITEYEDDFSEDYTQVEIFFEYEAPEPDGSCGGMIEVMSVKNAQTGEEYDETRVSLNEAMTKIADEAFANSCRKSRRYSDDY